MQPKPWVQSVATQRQIGLACLVLSKYGWNCAYTRVGHRRCSHVALLCIQMASCWSSAPQLRVTPCRAPRELLRREETNLSECTQ